MKFETKYLSDVVFFQEGPGVRKFQFRNEGVKLLNVGNINNGVLDTSTTELYIAKEEAYSKYKHFLVDEGDLIIASSGIVVDNFHNKIAYARKEHLPLCLNTSTMRFKTLNNDDFHLDYLKYFLKTNHFKKQLKKLITGSAQLNFGPSHLKKITIPVPSFSDQIQIANILSKAETLIEQRKQSIALLDEFLKSTFLEMFGEPVRNVKAWPKKKFGNSIKVKHGFAFKSEFFSNKGEYVLLTPGNFHEDGGYRDRMEKQKYYIGEIPKGYILKKGSLLIAMTEQAPGLLGSPIIVPASNQFLHNQRLGLVEFSEREFTATFLFYFFCSNSTKYIIHKRATGTKVRHTSPSKIEEMIIFYPPIELQIQFANIVTKTEALKEQYKNSLQELENLYGSLSQRAFKGELKMYDSEVK